MKKLLRLAIVLFSAMVILTVHVYAVQLGHEVTYSENICNEGLQKNNGAGVFSKSKGLETFYIKLLNSPTGVAIKYQGHIQNAGWQDPVYTEDNSLKLDAIKITLENTSEYSVQYQAYVKNIGWQPWVSDGQIAGTVDGPSRLEAVRIKIVPNSAQAVHPSSISLSKTEDVLIKGAVDYLNADIQPKNTLDNNVLWYSSDSTVVSVNNTGKIKAIKAGSAVISVETQDGGKIAQCTVNVKDPPVCVSSINLNKTTDLLYLGDTDNLTSVVLPDDATDKSVKWVSSDNSIVNVDNTGKITAINVGTARITAITTDGKKSAVCNVTVTGKSDGVSVYYQEYSQDTGWQPWIRNEGDTDTPVKDLKIEALKIELVNAPEGAKIKYQAKFKNTGWQSLVYSGTEVGSEGQSNELEAIRLSLENMPGYSVEYQVYTQGKGWGNWVVDGETAGSEINSSAIIGIRIRIVKNIDAQYKIHVQDIGWEPYVQQGTIASTIGENRRIEAINIKLDNVPDGASVKYQVYIEGMSWQPWKMEGEDAGTVGQSLKIEAIRIMLINAPGYSIQYQVDVQNLGWQTWVSDGQDAGVLGLPLGIRGIRIKVIRNPNNIATAPITQPSQSVLNTLSDKLSDYISVDANVKSVNERAVALHGGFSSNNCVFFSSEALRRIGISVPTGMCNTTNYVPYLLNKGWKENYNADVLTPGDVCFTVNDSGGHPTHTFCFLDWLNPDDHTLAYVADNQSNEIHIRSLVQTQQYDAFAFFFYLF